MPMLIYNIPLVATMPMLICNIPLVATMSMLIYNIPLVATMPMLIYNIPLVAPMPMLIYNFPLLSRYEEDSNPLLVEHISMLQDMSCRSLAMLVMPSLKMCKVS